MVLFIFSETKRRVVTQPVLLFERPSNAGHGSVDVCCNDVYE